MPGQQARDGVGGGHEQALVSVDEVHGGVLHVHELGEHGQSALGGPLLGGEQHRGGAVGERGGVAGRHGRLVPQLAAERGLQAGQLLRRGVGAEVVVAGQAVERGHQIVHVPGGVGGAEVPVGGRGELVLGLTGDAPLVGGQGLVLAHGHAGARLARAGRLGHELPGAQLGEGAQAVLRGLGGVELQQHAARAVRERDGRVRDRVHAAADGGVELAEPDLVGEGAQGLHAGGAGHLDVGGRGGGGERGAQDGLAGEVEVARVLEDGAGGDLAEALALEPEPRDEAVERGREHLLVPGLGVGGVGTGEGDAVAAQDDGGAQRSTGDGGAGGGLGRGGLVVGHDGPLDGGPTADAAGAFPPRTIRTSAGWVTVTHST